MTVKVNEVALFNATCDKCKRMKQHTSRLAADKWGEEHDAEHLVHAAVGASLKGQVFDTDAHSWFGSATPAIEAANSKGYAFLTWNGWVFTANNAMVKMCAVSDVEGLSE